MDDDTIKLDKRSFEALAANSRVSILKSLSKRRKTLTELAGEIGLSNSTMKEHLDVLASAGLVIQRDEGRKWKYYELTRKGKGIVAPHELKVLIMLAVSLLLVFGSGWNFINVYSSSPGGEMLMGAADAVPAMEPAGIEKQREIPKAESAVEEDYSSEWEVPAGSDLVDDGESNVSSEKPVLMMSMEANESVEENDSVENESSRQELGLADGNSAQVNSQAGFPLEEAIIFGLSFGAFLVIAFLALSGRQSGQLL